MPSRLILYIAVVLIVHTSCGRRSDDAKMFDKLDPSRSGIHFNNEIHDGDSSYSFINEFGYMGGGVGIGDFNNDGLKDIFFSGNQVSSKLYINKGDNRFEDITTSAGVSTSDWATGVSIVDINHDGYDDIYVCVIGKDLVRHAANLLFINQHDLTFIEQAKQYGLADTGYSSQAAFFDYDRDGDLDMYLANYLLADRNANTIFPRDFSGRSPANDRLYRNDGDSTGHPVFTDVSMAAGIREDGYGLSVSIADYNTDGWPDIFVGNDFLSNDELWLNNRNGTFTNTISRSMQHQSYSSMGADAADLNNDALPDIVVLDMLPEYNGRKKTSFSFMTYERYQSERQMGYEPEFMRNVLQLNQGHYSTGDTLMPFFSEIGQLSGIQATDWSWSVLLADFNNDGRKDIHITNGTGRDFINADFLEFSSTLLASNMSKEERREAIRKKLASLQHVTIPNYLYLNDGDYRFTDVSFTAGIDEPSMSNGAAYADLDNDGDLDLITNNINQEAFVFINNANNNKTTPRKHFIKVQLNGDSLNRRGFGAKVSLYAGGKIQMQEQYPVRGYFSTVDPDLLFGTDTVGHIDSIVVTWPDLKTQVVKNPSIDTLLTLSISNAAATPPAPFIPGEMLFTDITARSGINYMHHENSFDDYSVQRLLPQKFSQMGPFIATGDINKDGLTDFYTGGGFNFPGYVFTQTTSGTFTSGPLVNGIKMEEDMDCVFFDADGDGDQDLLVTNGDVQYEPNSPFYRPRLYSNDGKGNFLLQPAAIPDSVRTIAGCVATNDYDNDGDIDLFIGGRVADKYPLAPRSFLLQNNGGIFSDVTFKVCPSLANAGMITAAAWADINNDKQPELIIAGEWMPIRIFRNERGALQELTTNAGLDSTHGMWRSLQAVDMDNDGDIDLVAGNLGLNCDYRVSQKEPMKLLAADIDGNGTIDPVMFYYIKSARDKEDLYPAISRGMFATQVPGIKKRFLLNSDYAKATADDIFSGKVKDKMLSLYCSETASCYFENNGMGKFIKHVLPMEAQFAPVNAILATDLDGDGQKDLLLAGNEFQSEVMNGRYDASYGLFLKGNGKGSFKPFSAAQSGFRLTGDVKDLALVEMKDGRKWILATVNNDSLRVFSIRK